MQWPRKLYEHEEIPPPHCWEEIREKLAGEPVKVGNALFEMEATPPATAWENIRQEISQTTDTPVAAPLPKITRRPVLSYAAAIIGLGILSAILIYVLNQQDAGLNVKDLAAGLTSTDSQRSKASTQEEAISRNTSPATAGQAEATPEDSRQMAGSQEKPVNQTADETSPGIVERATIASNQKKAPVKRSARQNSPGTMPVVSFSDGNYIQLVEPDGDVTRVSYKLAEMVRTVHQPRQKMSRQEQQRWNRTLEEWKAKMAQSTYTPSGSNFFDIAEMIEFLSEEQ